MVLTKELIEMATAVIVVIVLAVGAISFYMLDAARVAFSEKYTMDDLDRVSLSYLVKDCFEKSGGIYIKTSWMDSNSGMEIEDLCGIEKDCSVSVRGKTAAGESREWLFSPEMNIDPSTGLDLGTRFEDSHTIYVSIGEDDENIRVGELVVSV